MGTLIGLKIEEFERQLAVNLAGPLIVTQAYAGLVGGGGSGKRGRDG